MALLRQLPSRCNVAASQLWPLSWSQLRTAFTDALRNKRLEKAIDFSKEWGSEKGDVPVKWDITQVQAMEAKLRRKLRMVDFVVEVRDARIPVSSLHPNLRRWAGKKPRIMVLNKTDLISHQDRVEWERHFEEKKMHVIWTSTIHKNGGISNLVRRFFEANFEVNRRRRRTNLILRDNRAVLACLVGHPKVGKKSLTERLIGPKPKTVTGPIPDKGRPDLIDASLTWYKVEGGIYLMNEPGIIPPLLDNPIACLRLAVCGNYDQANISEALVAEHFISHLGSFRSGRQIMDRIHADVHVHPSSLPAVDFLREVAEVKFDGDAKAAARHILEAFRQQEYGPVALEMPYMLHGDFKLEEPLIYDKDTATGIQNGICTQY